MYLHHYIHMVYKKRMHVFQNFNDKLTFIIVKRWSLIENLHFHKSFKITELLKYSRNNNSNIGAICILYDIIIVLMHTYLS